MQPANKTATAMMVAGGHCQDSVCGGVTGMSLHPDASPGWRPASPTAVVDCDGADGLPIGIVLVLVMVIVFPSLEPELRLERHRLSTLLADTLQLIGIEKGGATVLWFGLPVTG